MQVLKRKVNKSQLKQIIMFTFIRECLSEDGKGSSKRLIAFICAITLNISIGFVIGYDTIHSTIGDKDKFFAVLLVVFDLILLGLATTSQILSVVKGRVDNTPTSPPASTSKEEPQQQ